MMQTIEFDINRDHLAMLERQRNPELNKNRGAQTRHGIGGGQADQFIRLVIAYLETAISHVPFSTLSLILVNLLRSGGQLQTGKCHLQHEWWWSRCKHVGHVRRWGHFFDSSIHFLNHS